MIRIIPDCYYLPVVVAVIGHTWLPFGCWIVVVSRVVNGCLLVMCVQSVVAWLLINDC